jgi:nucleotide-binding universal stress UspA family protein
VDVQRRVVVSASTPDGLQWLAEQEGADVVVFGSAYRTPPGHVSPQRSTERLLDGGPVALAIAPANYRDDRITTIGLLAAPGDDASLDTARELAESLGATVTRVEREVDLLVVGSRSEAPHGRVMISASSERAIEDSDAPVLVVPRGVPVRFAALAPA